MHDLEHIAGIECRVKALVALIVRQRVKVHLIQHPAVFAVKYFSQKEEILFLGISELAEPSKEIPVEAVRNIEAQTVNVKEIDPVIDLIKDVIDDCGVSQVKLNKVVIAFPAFIPEAVIVIGVAVK